MTTDTLQKALTRLDETSADRTTLEAYYSGSQPLAYLTPEARAAIGNRFQVLTTNLCRVTVNALAERLRLVGFTGAHAAQVWADWKANDLDQMAPVAHREALALRESFVIVWADATGAPQVTIESAAQVAVLRDAATRQVTAAVKRWKTPTGTEAMLYEADTITRYHSDALGTSTETGFTVREIIPNPLGVVPVVPLRNSERLLGPGLSELEDLAPLVDAQNKLLSDMLVASEYSGRPRRWASGIELEEEPILDADGKPLLDETGEPITKTVNPFPEANRMMISEQADSKFGQLDAADLAGYEAAVRVIQAQVSAVTCLPPHYLGVHGDQPASADAMRASEAALVAKVEARQQIFGKAWEQVARLMVAIRTGADPRTVQVVAQWADPATRSIAQEADAVVKLFQAGLLPQEYALQRLGYGADEIARITALSITTKPNLTAIPA